MTYEDLSAVTDPMEAIKSLFAEMSSVKEDLSATRSEVARLNRVNSRLVVENGKLKNKVSLLEKENGQLKAEIGRLGGKKVEKDSTNSSIPPRNCRLESR